MLKAALCHTDRPEYALGMCASCYVQSVRNQDTKIKCDRDYEERNRKERNEQRRILAAKRRAAKKQNP